MTIRAKFIKAAAERKRYTVDYTDWLDTGEIASSVEFSVSPTTDPALVIDGWLLDGTSKILSFFASAGNDGDTYDVLITTTTSGGQVKEDKLQFTIREL